MQLILNCMKQRNVFLIIVGILVIILGGLTGYIIATQQKQAAIKNYDDCVAAGHPIQESHPPRCSVPGGKTFTQETDTETSFTGTVVCLPHRNNAGPHTLECVTGLKTDEGKYYALHTGTPEQELAATAGSDKKVRVNGSLAHDHSTVYQTEGTIHVSDFSFL